MVNRLRKRRKISSLNQITVSLNPVAYEQLYNAALPHETYSDTIIRLIAQYRSKQKGWIYQSINKANLLIAKIMKRREEIRNVKS